MTILRSPLRTALRSSVYSPLVGKWGGEAVTALRREDDGTVTVVSLARVWRAALDREDDGTVTVRMN